MANIPGTKFAQGTPSANTGQTTWQTPRQGDGGIPEALGKMGGVLFNYALNVERKKMAAEYSKIKREIDERGWLANESLIGDDTADKAVLEKFRTEAQTFADSSEYNDVRDSAHEHLNSVMPNWEHAMRTKSLGIQSQNATFQLRYEYENQLSINNLDGANEILGQLERLDPSEKSRIETLRKEQPMALILAMAERKMLEGDGKGAQADLAEFKDNDATTKQLDQKNMLEYNIKKLNEGKESGVEMEARQLAIEGDWQGGIDKINAALPELGVDWHTNALNKYRNAFSILNETGTNVFTTTQNWSLYNDHRKRAASKSITEKEIMDSVGVNGYSWTQAEHLLTVLNGKSSLAKAFEDSAAAKNLITLTKDLYDPIKDAEMSQFVNQRGLGLLEDWIDNNPDATDREKKERALIIGRQLQDEDESGLLELGLEAVIKPKAPITGEDFDKIDLSEIKRFSKKKGITKAEFDKLPSGAIFIAPDGKKRRKP